MIHRAICASALALVWLLGACSGDKAQTPEDPAPAAAEGRGVPPLSAEQITGLGIGFETAQAATEAMRDYTRRLDALVVAQEQQPDVSEAQVQEIKQVVHQLKQMLRAGELILRDMRGIRLPA